MKISEKTEGARGGSRVQGKGPPGMTANCRRAPPAQNLFR
jgi:hypothetical protein